MKELIETVLNQDRRMKNRNDSLMMIGLIGDANENFILDLTWEDGTQTRLDLNERIHQNDKFRRLRNPRYFKKVSVDILGSICWPEEEDLSPNFLAFHSRSSIK